MDLLIDDKGTVWDASSGRLRQRFGLHVSRKALPSFLVRHLGYARVSISSSSCDVRAAPFRMKYRTYAAIVDLLKTYDFHRLSLSVYSDGDWKHQIFREKKALQYRLHDLMYWHREGEDERYIAQPRELGSLRKGEPLEKLFEAWREVSGKLSVEDQSDLFQRVLRSKFSVLAVKPGEGKIKFTRIGEGFAIYDPGWRHRMIGMPAEEQPDVEYGRLVSNELRTIWLDKEPALIDVDALIKNPDAQANERWRYTRLALPVKSKAGEYELLAVTLPNPDIDLRIQFQHEHE